MALVWILAIIAVLVALVCVVVGATAAARRGGSGPDPREWLIGLRSPSGKRFFPTKESARDLMASLEEVPDLKVPDRDRQSEP
jgi:hypothetical protein